MLKDISTTIASRFVSGFQQPVAVRAFFRFLVAYTLIKTLLVWPLSRMVMEHHTITLPRSLPGKLLMAPSFLANHHVDVFIGLGILLMFVLLVVRQNYLGTLFFFWFTFNMYTVNLPFADGSDVVLFMLALWAVPMATLPSFKNEKVKIVQQACYNLAVLFCQLQVVYIYLVSGSDKLMSATWRSGLAFDYIRHLEVLYNPVIPAVLQSGTWNIVFSWGAILFEMAFVVLIWIRKTRIPIIIVGVLFHLGIWAVLSLPDFAMVMIVSYLIFLRDADYDALRQWIRRSPR
jgi:hypothetical protein